MKILTRSSQLFLVLGCLLLSSLKVPSLAWAQASTHKTVLLLFPYQVDLAVMVLESQAIQAELGQATDLTLEVYAEYLDFNRFQDEAYWQQLSQLYATKYGQKPIDLVLVGNEATLNWWLKYRAPIAPSAPVVVYDIATDRLTALSLPPEVTGVSGEVDYAQSVQWILRARPTVKEVVLVHGVGPADQRYHSEVDTLQAALRGQVQFSDLSDRPLADIKQRVAGLPQTSIVLAMPMFEDAAGVKYQPMDAMRELAAASSVPVLSGYDLFIGSGTVGGYLYSVEQQARDAAQLGLRLLRGEPLSAVPPVSHQSSRFIFDHLALQRFNIPLSALPPDSIVKNRQYSLWEQYRPQIIAVSAGFTVLLLLVIILLGALRQLNRTRGALAHLNASLETQVAERTATLDNANARLKEEIAERAQTETALHESEARTAAILRLSPVVIGVSTVAEGRYIEVNETFERVLGYSRAETLGQTSFDLNLWVDADTRPTLVQEIRTRGRVENMEIHLRRKSGEVFPALVFVEPIELQNTPCVINMILDITERKQTEDQLRRLNKEVAVSEERQRLARDLHDSVTQLLYGLMLSAATAEQQLQAGNTAQARPYLADARQTAQQVLKEMRLLLYELRPETLQSHGLVATLRLRLESVERRAGISSNLTVSGLSEVWEPGVLMPQWQEELYRVATEALNNTLKYAAATTVNVRLGSDGCGLEMEIADSGQGFDLPAAANSGGLGLSTMRERVERLNGNLTIETNPGHGTLVRVRMPWPTPSV